MAQIRRAHGQPEPDARSSKGLEEMHFSHFSVPEVVTEMVTLVFRLANEATYGERPDTSRSQAYDDFTDHLMALERVLLVGQHEAAFEYCCGLLDNQGYFETRSLERYINLIAEPLALVRATAQVFSEDLGAEGDDDVVLCALLVRNLLDRIFDYLTYLRHLESQLTDKATTSPQPYVRRGRWQPLSQEVAFLLETSFNNRSQFKRPMEEFVTTPDSKDQARQYAERDIALFAGNLSDEPLAYRLMAVQALGELANAALTELVGEAREAGRTWQSIGNVLGISQPAAMRRFDPEAKKKHREYQQRKRTSAEQN